MFKSALKFFSHRMKVSLEHSLLERELLEKNITAENYSKVTYAAEATAFALWRFVDSMMESYGKTPKPMLVR